MDSRRVIVNRINQILSLADERTLRELERMVIIWIKGREAKERKEV